MDKQAISYSDFARMDLRIGTILECSEVEGSQKLVKFLVDLGDLGKRTILAGIKGQVKPEEIVGLQVLVLANLQPKMMMGQESQGMILMGVEKTSGDFEGDGGVEEEKITLLIPENKVPSGTGVE